MKMKMKMRKWLCSMICNWCPPPDMGGLGYDDDCVDLPEKKKIKRNKYGAPEVYPWPKGKDE